MSSKISRVIRCLALTGVLLPILGGCALFEAGGPQQIEVHALFRQRELAGVGCMLANDGGRWTVVAPGRVTVARSRTPLSVDCVRREAGSLAEQADAPADLARLDAHLRIPAEGGRAGARFDIGSGTRFAYPATLHIDLQAPAAPGAAQAPATPVF